MHEIVKKYYDLGLYKTDKVKDFCRKGKITPAEYEKITGQPYDG